MEINAQTKAGQLPGFFVFTGDGMLAVTFDREVQLSCFRSPPIQSKMANAE